MNVPIDLIFLTAVFVGFLAAISCFKQKNNVLREINDLKKISIQLTWRFCLMALALYIGHWFGFGLVAEAETANIHAMIIGVAISFNLIILLSEIGFTALLRYCFLRRT